MGKRVLIAFATSIAALAFAAPPASAVSDTAQNSVNAGTANIETRLCNYRVWPADGVNIHRSPDRSSTIVGHRPQNYVFRNITCGNTEGGKYGSCGTGILWKSLGNSYVATKCLVPA